MTRRITATFPGLKLDGVTHNTLSRVREIPALVTLAFGKVGILVSESIAKPAPASTEFTEVYGVTPVGTVCQTCPDSLGSFEDRCESAVALETLFLRREAWSGEDGNWGAGTYFGVLGRRKTKSYMEELSKADFSRGGPKPRGHS